ncbi:hypothetical protein GLAREA_00465 [Glarea lozoyensis ATCC 20868]|uniref:Uncharacterized protein n=1 Tax=Glarea lozoyensis (strain ATCC 20868 / MF5171) TaxID=1116229 RepID=S3CUL5_GLAL2|nr:uncharacterized protein GLAREA_00465 [Glarea lozoyensis ATCC 20868]EPE29305.1 hypothetical protein GLAREA_00465 [Glarea lozoyensis ATCC 20868]
MGGIGAAFSVILTGEEMPAVPALRSTGTAGREILPGRQHSTGKREKERPTTPGALGVDAHLGVDSSSGGCTNTDLHRECAGGVVGCSRVAGSGSRDGQAVGLQRAALGESDTVTLPTLQKSHAKHQRTNFLFLQLPPVSPKSREANLECLFLNFTSRSSNISHTFAARIYCNISHRHPQPESQ